MRNWKLVLASALALVLVGSLAAPAQADSVYLIVAEDGVFARPGEGWYSQSYQIVNYATVLGGTYPWPLAMEVAAYVEVELSTPKEFFYLGTATEDLGEVSDLHLLVGAPGTAEAMPLPFVNSIASDIASTSEGSPFPSGLGSTAIVNNSTFWGWFDAENASDFLRGGEEGSVVPFNVISNLAEGEGVENIFGFCHSVSILKDEDPTGALTWTYDGSEINPTGSSGLWRPVPEPSSLALMLGGLLVAGAIYRRRRSAS